MRTNILRVLGIAGSLMLMAVIAHADPVVAEANIPFDFEVGSAVLPAGVYTIEREQPPMGAYLIQSIGGGHACFFSANSALPKTGKDPEWTFVFDKVGDKYFLRHVWLGSSSTGLELPKSKHEREFIAMGRVESIIEIAETGR